jgi:hypothetical protein
VWVEELFKAVLNYFVSFERLFILGGRWLNYWCQKIKLPFGIESSYTLEDVVYVRSCVNVMDFLVG